jgi:hypothetical protein
MTSCTRSRPRGHGNETQIRQWDEPGSSHTRGDVEEPVIIVGTVPCKVASEAEQYGCHETNAGMVKGQWGAADSSHMTENKRPHLMSTVGREIVWPGYMTEPIMTESWSSVEQETSKTQRISDAIRQKTGSSGP